jgi:hypothetical protein
MRIRWRRAKAWHASAERGGWYHEERFGGLLSHGPHSAERRDLQSEIKRIIRQVEARGALGGGEEFGGCLKAAGERPESRSDEGPWATAYLIPFRGRRSYAYTRRSPFHCSPTVLFTAISIST